MAAQAGFERKGGVSIPISWAPTMCQTYYLRSYFHLSVPVQRRPSEVKEAAALLHRDTCSRSVWLLCAWRLALIRPVLRGRFWVPTLQHPWKAA